MSIGTSNFLVFDENNTNIMTDADYLEHPQRKDGVGNGIADPVLHNKMFRQTTIMSTALAEFLASKGFTVNDSDYSGLLLALSNIALTNEIISLADDWLPNTKYILHQIVVNEGKLYRCSVPHTSLTVFDLTKFEVIGGGGSGGTGSIDGGNYADKYTADIENIDGGGY